MKSFRDRVFFWIRIRGKKVRVILSFFFWNEINVKERKKNDVAKKNFF